MVQLFRESAYATLQNLKVGSDICVGCVQSDKSDIKDKVIGTSVPPRVQLMQKVDSRGDNVPRFSRCPGRCCRFGCRGYNRRRRVKQTLFPHKIRYM